MLLEDVGHLAAQRVEVDAGDVAAVDQHTPGGGLQERRDQVGEARLAGPRRADDGDELAHLELQVDLGESPATVRVAELHVAKLDALPDRLKSRPPDPVLVHRVVHEEEHPAHGRHRSLQHDPEPADTGGGLQDAPDEAEDDEEVPGRHLSVDDLVGHQADDVDRRHDHQAEDDDEQADAHRQGKPLAQERLATALGKAFRVAAHAAEALYGVDVVHRFFDGVGRCGAGGALGLVHAAHKSRGRERDDEGERKRRPRDPHQFRRNVAVGVLDEVKVDRAPEERERRLQGQLVADLGHLRRVVENAVDRVADALVVKGGHRQARQPREEPRAQRVREALRQADVDHVFGDPPKAARATAPGADLVLALGGGIGAGEQADLLEAPRPRAEDQQHEHEQHGQGQHDLHRGHAVDDGDDRVHERRVGHVRVPERSLQEHVVGDDLAEPGQQQSRPHETEAEQELGREQSARFGEELQRAPHENGGLAGRHPGVEIDAVVVAQASLAGLAAALLGLARFG